MVCCGLAVGRIYAYIFAYMNIKMYIYIYRSVYIIFKKR